MTVYRDITEKLGLEFKLAHAEPAKFDEEKRAAFAEEGLKKDQEGEGKKGGVTQAKSWGTVTSARHATAARSHTWWQSRRGRTGEIHDASGQPEEGSEAAASTVQLTATGRGPHSAASCASSSAPSSAKATTTSRAIFLNALHVKAMRTTSRCSVPQWMRRVTSRDVRTAGWSSYTKRRTVVSIARR
jgi:hypothetical protein